MAETETSKITPEIAPTEDAVAPEPEPMSSEPVPDPIADPVPMEQSPVAAAPRRRSVFWPLAAGGALAAGLGAGGTFYLAQTMPELLHLGTSAGVEQRLSDLSARLEALTGQVAALPASADAARLEELGSGLKSAQAQLATLAEAAGKPAPDPGLAALEQRLKALEEAPPATAAMTPSQSDQAAREAEAAARAAEEAARAQEAKAAAKVRLADAQAALGTLRAALESGAAYGPALTPLTDAGLTVPETLISQSGGVPTLAALRAAFPDAARDALSLSLSETAGEGMWDRTTAFLQSQTHARSLTPRAGTDPDAVLSRAEAALAAGDLATAVKELAGLPPQGQARMAEWIGLAGRRTDAEAALAALAGQIE